MTAEEHYAEGCARAEAGEIAAAFVHLEKSIELKPENAEACKLLARLSLAVNEVRAFQNWCHEAARIAPEDPEPHWLLAQVCAASRRWEESAEALEKAARLLPEGDGRRVAWLRDAAQSRQRATSETQFKLER